MAKETEKNIGLGRLVLAIIIASFVWKLCTQGHGHTEEELGLAGFFTVLAFIAVLTIGNRG